MAPAKLTALAVERAQRSGKSVLLSDGDGLYLRKQTRDGASRTLRYRFAGREHWLTLGNYSDMSLALARIEARQPRVLLDTQQNPLSVRRAALEEERQKGSFKALCEDWYRAEVQARGLKHPGVPRRYLDKYLLPKLGRIAASDITPADVARVLDDLKGRAPTGTELRRTCAACREDPRDAEFRRGQSLRHQAAVGTVNSQGRTSRRALVRVRLGRPHSGGHGMVLASVADQDRREPQHSTGAHRGRVAWRVARALRRQ